MDNGKENGNYLPAAFQGYHTPGCNRSKAKQGAEQVKASGYRRMPLFPMPFDAHPS